MSDWSGGFGEGGRPPNAKIPAKVHRNVSLITTADAVLTEEILARPALAKVVVGRLSDTVLLVQRDTADVIVDELKRLGHTPKVTGSSG